MVIEHLDQQGFCLVLHAKIRLKPTENYMVVVQISLHFLMKICTFNLAQIPRKRFLTALLSNGVVIANFNGASPTNTLIHVNKSSTSLLKCFSGCKAV